MTKTAAKIPNENINEQNSKYEIEFCDVKLAYGKKEVVHGVSFGVEKGSFVGLVGPNGSGKSTIIKSLSKLLDPTSGRVEIRGKDIAHMQQKDIALQLAVVPQAPVLPSLFTAFEIVLMGRNPHMGFFSYESQNDMDIVDQAMEVTNTARFRDRRINELSGGEIQSVVIARAIAQDTEIIILDEPTAALDVTRQIEVLDFLRTRCKEKNVTIVTAIHDLNLAVHFCDRLILIRQGEVYADGDAETVITEDNLNAVYGRGNLVAPHPVTGLPSVLPTV